MEKSLSKFRAEGNMYLASEIEYRHVTEYIEKKNTK
jgi:hypothetical protein